MPLNVLLRSPGPHGAAWPGQVFLRPSKEQGQSYDIVLTFDDETPLPGDIVVAPPSTQHPSNGGDLPKDPRAKLNAQLDALLNLQQLVNQRIEELNLQINAKDQDRQNIFQ